MTAQSCDKRATDVTIKNQLAANHRQFLPKGVSDEQGPLSKVIV